MNLSIPFTELGIIQNSDWFPDPYIDRCSNPSSHGKPRQHDSYRRNQGNDTKVPVMESRNLRTVVDSQD